MRNKLIRAQNIPRKAKRVVKATLKPGIHQARRIKDKVNDSANTLKDKKSRKQFIAQKQANYCEKRGDLIKALEIWQQIFDYYGDKSPVIAVVEIARIQTKRKRFDDALKILEAATDWYPRTKTATDQDLRNWLIISRQKAETVILQKIAEKSEYKKQINSYIKTKKSKKNKIAIFTAVSGGYDSLKPPMFIDERFDYIVFTDHPFKSVGIYDVRPLPYVDSDNTRSARFVKTNPHNLLPEYDIAVWIDANLLITGDIYPIIESTLNSGKPFGAVRHAVRTSPFEEMEICMKQGRDNAESIKEQQEFYKKQGYDTNQLIESNVLVYDLRKNKLNDFLNEWWNQIDRFSKRDQISINYSLDKHKISWHKFAEYPKTPRSLKPFALMEHKAETLQTSIYKLLDNIDAKMLEIKPGVQYSRVKQTRLKNRKESITVVVPVHNAPQETRACIESIKKNKHDGLSLLLIDDGSADETKQILKIFSEKNKSWVKLIRHNHAKGYTLSVNEGFKVSSTDMTIILNSDTIVTKDWAQKIADVMFSSQGVGIVGPLSSAASHQSVPNIKSRDGQTAINELPKNKTPEDMNKYAEQWSYDNLFPRVPLVHGFCIAVKKEVIEKIGTFDEKLFPRGYGEENDFCFRATNAGFNLAVATNTYVFHHKSKSFISKEREKLMDDGMKALVRSHGQRRVDRAVDTMKKNGVLMALRDKFYSLYKS